MMKQVSIILVIMIVVLSITGCTGGLKVGYTSNSVGNSMAATFMKLEGFDTKQVKFEAGDEIVITYSFELESGSLAIVFEDKQGNVMENVSEEEGIYRVQISEAGRYKIGVEGVDAKGEYSLEWEVE